jgi:hypothetical protein
MSEIPEPDVSVYDLWVVARWYGNPHSDDPGSWSIDAGPYFKEDTAILAAHKMNKYSSYKGYKSMSLDDFHCECRNV